MFSILHAGGQRVTVAPYWEDCMVTRRKQQGQSQSLSSRPSIDRRGSEQPDDPAAFWGPDWREKLQEANDDVTAGRVQYFDSDQELLTYLDEQIEAS